MRWPDDRASPVCVCGRSGLLGSGRGLDGPHPGQGPRIKGAPSLSPPGSLGFCQSAAMPQIPFSSLYFQSLDQHLYCLIGKYLFKKKKKTELSQGGKSELWLKTASVPRNHILIMLIVVLFPTAIKGKFCLPRLGLTFMFFLLPHTRQL